jgi:hypothetical protein
MSTKRSCVWMTSRTGIRFRRFQIDRKAPPILFLKTTLTREALSTCGAQRHIPINIDK